MKNLIWILLVLVMCSCSVADKEDFVLEGKAYTYSEIEGEPADIYNELEQKGTTIAGLEIERHIVTTQGTVILSTLDVVNVTDDQGAFSFTNDGNVRYEYLPNLSGSIYSLHSEITEENSSVVVFEVVNVAFHFKLTNGLIDETQLQYSFKHPIEGNHFVNPYYDYGLKEDKANASCMANVNLELHYRYGLGAPLKVFPFYSGDGTLEYEVLLD